MKPIPSGSVDLILADPPYGTIENTPSTWKADTAWDRTLEPSAIFQEANRLLRPSGALVLFSQEPYTSRLITEAHPNVPFSYRMVWLKDTFGNHLLAKKAPVSYFEDVVVFFKNNVKHDFVGGHPLRPYAEQVKQFIGKPKKQVFAEMGHQGVCHFFRTESAQFTICTPETYAQLCELYNLRAMPGFREFETLVPVNEAYRDELIRELGGLKVFNLSRGAAHKSNVLYYAKDGGNFHTTQKPVALLEDLVRTYSNAGDMVLDFTMGSGSTGVACVRTGRRFTGIEIDAGHFETSVHRIAAASPTFLATERDMVQPQLWTD